MRDELARLKSRLFLAQARLRDLDQMIKDAHLWGSRVSVAHAERADALNQCDLLIARIDAIEERARCVRLHS